MTAQTPATAEMKKWLRIGVRLFTIFWLRVRKKNAESCRSRLRHCGSRPTSARDHFLIFFKCFQSLCSDFLV